MANDPQGNPPRAPVFACAECGATWRTEWQRDLCCTAPPEPAKTTDPDIQISRRLREALGFPDEPGTCQDCGGVGVVPATDLSKQHNTSLWKECPTCRGGRMGGRA